MERPAERAERLRLLDVVVALVERAVPVVEDELVVERLGGRLVVRDQELRQHGAAADAAHVRDGAPGADALRPEVQALHQLGELAPDAVGDEGNRPLSDLSSLKKRSSSNSLSPTSTL